MIPTDSNPLIQNTIAKNLLMSYKYEYLEQLPERYHDEEELKVPEKEPEHPENAPVQVHNNAKWQLPEEVSLLGDTEFIDKVGMTKKPFKFNAW